MRLSSWTYNAHAQQNDRLTSGSRPDTRALTSARTSASTAKTAAPASTGPAVVDAGVHWLPSLVSIPLRWAHVLRRRISWWNSAPRSQAHFVRVASLLANYVI
jgi:hypothetical protein